MKVGFVSLGCSKNLVDTEMAIGLFKNNNFEIVNEDAEIAIFTPLHGCIDRNKWGILCNRNCLLIFK